MNQLTRSIQTQLVHCLWQTLFETLTKQIIFTNLLCPSYAKMLADGVDTFVCFIRTLIKFAKKIAPKDVKRYAILVLTVLMRYVSYWLRQERKPNMMDFTDQTVLVTAHPGGAWPLPALKRGCA